MLEWNMEDVLSFFSRAYSPVQSHRVHARLVPYVLRIRKDVSLFKRLSSLSYNRGGVIESVGLRGQGGA